MKVSIRDLKAKRAAMTQGEWRLQLDRNDQQNIHTDSLWIALLPHQCLTSIEREQERNATGIVATHNAADVLIEIAEAALAIHGQTLTDQEHTERLSRLSAALRKVQP